MGSSRGIKRWWLESLLLMLLLAFVVCVLGATGSLGSVLRWFGALGAETYVGALSAAGTIAAAIVALRIATTDRRERREERRAEERARANLVVVEIDGRSIRDSDPYISVVVDNHSGRSILDVSVIELAIDGIASRKHFHPVDACLSVIALGRGGNDFRFTPDTEYMLFAMRGVATPGDDDIFENPEKYAPLITDRTSFVATIQFTDAEGKRWRKSSIGELIGPIEKPPAKAQEVVTKSKDVIELPIETLVTGDLFVPRTGDPALDRPWLILRIDQEGDERHGFVRALYRHPDDETPAIRQREGTLVRCIRKAI